MSRSGETPIFARLTISGQRAEFNINRSVDPDNWNAAKGLSKGKSKRDLELNKYLDSIRVRISEIHTMLVKEEEVINPNVIKQHFLGNAEGPKMIVGCSNVTFIIGGFMTCAIADAGRVRHHADITSAFSDF